MTPFVFPVFTSTPADAVTQTDGTFTLAQPGTYLITATVNLDQTLSADSSLRLTQNGAVIPASITPLPAAAGAGSYTLSAIVTSGGADTIALTAEDDLTLTVTDPDNVLATITFLKLA